MRSADGDLNAYDLLQAVQNFTGTSCARRVQLERLASDTMYQFPFSIDGLERSRNQLASLERLDEEVHTSDGIELRLLGREIARAIEFANNPDNFDGVQILLSFEASQTQLELHLESSIEFFRSKGLDFERPEIFLVEELPAPFDRGSASVVTIDAEDEQRFEIKAGIYFTRHAITPIFADYTIAHELVHWVLGLRTPSLMATQFEEGVADFVALFGYVSEQYGELVSRNTALIHRLTSASGLVWENYVDASRATYLAVTRTGFSDLYAAIGRGREFLDVYRRSYARSVIATAAQAFVAPGQVLLDFPRNRVVSALAFEVANYVRPGRTVFEIAELGRMSRELAEVGIAELESAGYVTTRRDKIVIEYAPVTTYIEDGEFRYDFRRG